MFSFGNGYIWAAVVALVGALQAWDSGVLESTRAVQLSVALAIFLPAAALALLASLGWLITAIVVAFGLLTLARFIAPDPLPTLHLIAFIPSLIVIFARRPAPHTVAGISE